MVGIVQPEETRDSVSIPGRKQRRSNACQALARSLKLEKLTATDQVRKNGNCDSQDERNSYGRNAQRNPNGPSQDRVCVHVLRVSEVAHKNNLGSCMGIESTSTARF